MSQIELQNVKGTPPYMCSASKQSLPELADCDWPFCGCDPVAQRVLDAIHESGFELIRPAFTPEVEKGAINAMAKTIEDVANQSGCLMTPVVARWIASAISAEANHEIGGI